MSQGINTYLFADYFKDTKALALFSLLNLPSGIIVAVVSGKISMRYGKKEAASIGCFLAGIIYLILSLIHILLFKKRYMIIFQIVDDIVYADCVVDCRQDYNWLIQ